VPNAGLFVTYSAYDNSVFVYVSILPDKKPSSWISLVFEPC
jgi:hypothetical protein